MRKLSLICIVFLLCITIKAQSESENWIPISIETEKTLFINIAGISNYTGEEIIIWALQEMNPPLIMEEVHGNIYKVKTEYSINKKLLRYSITQIIYYDDKGNILKHYTYGHNSTIVEFKYNYPITKDSDVSKILSKCKEIIDTSNKK
jgi:hypothetical protein